MGCKGSLLSRSTLSGMRWCECLHVVTRKNHVVTRKNELRRAHAARQQCLFEYLSAAGVVLDPQHTSSTWASHGINKLVT